ncbi:uncharacterized protein LOC131354795 [Hemibagrus wyckioides]|uniref:uncharacterized protein LOC131354795 n=1 Tax=Hemibagrus wyckioides TaxID=337641 RepID=UPI00266D6384|nr:uncharacterized protein LOC131354795 [Hemibagrus wyckioides]
MARRSYMQGIVLSFILFGVGCVHCENIAAGTNYTFKPAIPGVIELGVWKHSGYLVVDSELKSEPFWYHYKERAHLNTETGDLTLQVKKEDSGVFQAHLQVQGTLKYFERMIIVIDPVPEPKVTCEQNELDIRLLCSVNPPMQAEFTWSGPNGFSHVGNSVNITRNQNDDSIYYCTAKNKVSQKEAEFKLKDCVSDGCVHCGNIATGTNYTFKPAISGAIEVGDWRYNGELVVEWESNLICLVW